MEDELLDQWDRWLQQNDSLIVSSLRLPGEDLLTVIRLGAKDSRAPSVLLTSGLHGDEPAGPVALLEVLQEKALHPGISWTIVPYLNPHGLRQGVRENPRGYDLNREFLRDRAAEVCFYKQNVPALGPYDVMLSLHEDWEFRGSYLYEINSGTRPSLAPGIVEILERETGLAEADLIDDHPVSKPGLIIHHPDADEPEDWPEAIFMIKQQPLLSYTLETPSQRPLKERVRCQRRVIQFCAEALGASSAGDGL